MKLVFTLYIKVDPILLGVLNNINSIKNRLKQKSRT